MLFVALHFTYETKVILTGEFNLPNIDWTSDKLDKTEVASFEPLLYISVF